MDLFFLNCLISKSLMVGLPHMRNQLLVITAPNLSDFKVGGSVLEPLSDMLPVLEIYFKQSLKY
jgi:hypothetical protein